MTTQEKWADKIAKLLRKAESTTPEEAEALIAKAQQLMTSYAIDQAMLDRARGENTATREKIVQAELEYTGIFQQALMGIGSAIAQYNDCRCVYYNRNQDRPRKHVLTVTGFESDVERVRMLDASVQIQCASALTTWYKAQDTSWMSGMEKYKNRREFIFGFVTGLGTNLDAGRKAGVAEAVQNEADRSSSTSEQASESVALVLRSRKDQVDDWFDERYGKTLRSYSRHYSPGSYDASAAGHAAGRRADVSSRSGVGGRRRELRR